jgi:xanthine dehydrogenase YagR molybdenum-binding subunit
MSVLSPYIGGGFGAKLRIQSDAVLAALGRARPGRPVKVASDAPAADEQQYPPPGDIQRVRIGATATARSPPLATRAGRATCPAAPGDRHRADQAALCRRQSPDDRCGWRARSARGQLDARAGRSAGHDGAGDRHGRDGRKAADGPSRVAHPQRHPGRSEKPGRKFSQRQPQRMPALGRRALRLGQAQPAPGKVRDGQWLVGMGVAAAFRNNLQTKSAARVRLEITGHRSRSKPT